jgi:CheY-like chemotaxis protein
MSLGKQGYRTADACDGREALDAMRAGPADLVELDFMMPRLTGWEVLTERAAETELRRIPVIVITGERGDDVGKASSMPGPSAAGVRCSGCRNGHDSRQHSV